MLPLFLAVLLLLSPVDPRGEKVCVFLILKRVEVTTVHDFQNHITIFRDIQIIQYDVKDDVKICCVSLEC